MQLLRYVEAGDLARRGNQIGSKPGCVIFLSLLTLFLYKRNLSKGTIQLKKRDAGWIVVY
jgi:hypothetical protein